MPTVPVADGLFDTDAAGVALLGSRCTGCDSHYFPTAVSCRNPDCAEKTVHETRLGRTGVLYSWTVQHYRPPALFAMADWAPSAIGLVELPEGLRVLAMLTGAPAGEIPIGAELSLTMVRLHDDLVTYAYAPAVSE